MHSHETLPLHMLVELQARQEGKVIGPNREELPISRDDIVGFSV